jgi:hypothetical protein
LTKKVLKKENAREARHNSWSNKNKNKRREESKLAIPNKSNNPREAKSIQWNPHSISKQIANNRWQ